MSAYEFKLNKNDWQYINNSNKKNFIKNRLGKYQTLKKKVVNYELIRKLSHVNSFMNKIFSKHDIDSKSSIDHWATPKEFLLQGHGDCEDYAISKYFTLLELNIPKEKLYFAVVNIKGVSTAHMVLLYLENKNATPLVLDNLSFKVIPLTKRKKLIPKFAFNEIDSYKFTKERFTKKVRVNWGKEDKWNKLLKRVYRDKE
jgi:predicted transglutaminase-like cysteine proteinase